MPSVARQAGLSLTILESKIVPRRLKTFFAYAVLTAVLKVIRRLRAGYQSLQLCLTPLTKMQKMTSERNESPIVGLMLYEMQKQRIAAHPRMLVSALLFDAPIGLV